MFLNVIKDYSKNPGTFSAAAAIAAAASCVKFPLLCSNFTNSGFFIQAFLSFSPSIPLIVPSIVPSFLSLNCIGSFRILILLVPSSVIFIVADTILVLAPDVHHVPGT